MFNLTEEELKEICKQYNLMPKKEYQKKVKARDSTNCLWFSKKLK